MIWTVIGTIGVVAGTLLVGLWADRKWGIFPRKELLDPPRPSIPGHAAGEAPSVAIRVTPAQLEQLRRTQRCHRELMRPLPDDEVLYDQQVLRILRFQCARCEAVKSIYVRGAG